MPRLLLLLLLLAAPSPVAEVMSLSFLFRAPMAILSLGIHRHGRDGHKAFAEVCTLSDPRTEETPRSSNHLDKRPSRMYSWKLTGLMSNSVSDTMRQITGVRMLLKCRHTVFHPSDVSCKPPRPVGEQLEPQELRVPKDPSTFE